MQEKLYERRVNSFAQDYKDILSIPNDVSTNLRRKGITTIAQLVSLSMGYGLNGFVPGVREITASRIESQLEVYTKSLDTDQRREADRLKEEYQRFWDESAFDKAKKRFFVENGYLTVEDLLRLLSHHEEIGRLSRKYHSNFHRFLKLAQTIAIIAK
ncbi:hypothetical protein HY041_01165 [Candidatus Roizmanbacteria bacterium]|nr:hypothetical protein [Candidatus Roizmanbacteria bacterium]